MKGFFHELLTSPSHPSRGTPRRDAFRAEYDKRERPRIESLVRAAREGVRAEVQKPLHDVCVCVCVGAGDRKSLKELTRCAARPRIQYSTFNLMNYRTPNLILSFLIVLVLGGVVGIKTERKLASARVNAQVLQLWNLTH